MKKNLHYKLTNLIIADVFCQSLSPSLYRGSNVLNFIYLLFKKGGSPFPLRGPCPALARAI